MDVGNSRDSSILSRYIEVLRERELRMQRGRLVVRPVRAETRAEPKKLYSKGAQRRVICSSHRAGFV